ncbi:MAG: hypothetical protein WC091_02015 [Sulfuricellaceae bacterium]
MKLSNGLFNPATRLPLKSAEHALFFQATFMDIWETQKHVQKKLQNMSDEELIFVLDFLLSHGQIKIHLDENCLKEKGKGCEALIAPTLPAHWDANDSAVYMVINQALGQHVGKAMLLMQLIKMGALEQWIEVSFHKIIKETDGLISGASIFHNTKRLQNLGLIDSRRSACRRQSNRYYVFGNALNAMFPDIQFSALIVPTHPKPILPTQWDANDLALYMAINQTLDHIRPNKYTNAGPKAVMLVQMIKMGGLEQWITVSLPEFKKAIDGLLSTECINRNIKWLQNLGLIDRQLAPIRKRSNRYYVLEGALNAMFPDIQFSALYAATKVF